MGLFFPLPPPPVISQKECKQTTTLFSVLENNVKTYRCTKHAYIVLGCIACIFNGEIGASKANILNKGLTIDHLSSVCGRVGNDIQNVLSLFNT